MHAEPDVHETPERTLLLAPAGLGVGLTFQADPLHCSPSIQRVPEPSS
jgi:hypothetical protein